MKFSYIYIYLYTLFVALCPITHASPTTCPLGDGPLNRLWQQAQTEKSLLSEGTYQLQQAQVIFQHPSSKHFVEVQYLVSPGDSVVGVLLCPAPKESPKFGTNLMVITEAVLETIEVRNGQILLKDSTRLWDLVVLTVDHEVHLQPVDTPIFNMGEENLTAESLTQVPGLEFIPTPDALLIKYMNVILLYKRL